MMARLLGSCVVLLVGAAAQNTENAAKKAVDTAASSLGAICGTPSSDPVRTALALHSMGAINELKACLLKRLRKKSASVVAWGLTAKVLPHQAALAEHAEALLRGQPCTSRPLGWDVLGPFPIGKNEVDGDPIAGLREGSAIAHWLAYHNHSSLSREALVASEVRALAVVCFTLCGLPATATELHALRWYSW